MIWAQFWLFPLYLDIAVWFSAELPTLAGIQYDLWTMLSLGDKAVRALTGVFSAGFCMAV